MISGEDQLNHMENQRVLIERKKNIKTLIETYSDFYYIIHQTRSANLPFCVSYWHFLIKSSYLDNQKKISILSTQSYWKLNQELANQQVVILIFFINKPVIFVLGRKLIIMRTNNKKSSLVNTLICLTLINKYEAKFFFFFYGKYGSNVDFSG